LATAAKCANSASLGLRLDMLHKLTLSYSIE
jgi:hypothetical protein